MSEFVGVPSDPGMKGLYFAGNELDGVYTALQTMLQNNSRPNVFEFVCFLAREISSPPVILQKNITYHHVV